MRLLLITDEVWNDKIHGNNILTNWFEGMDIEIANIYCSPGMPDNRCCQKYFQITDGMMAKSILKRGQRAGRAFVWNSDQQQEDTGISAEAENKKFYSFMKSITTESIRAVREWLWLHGRYDEVALKRFIEEFDPDIVYSPRYATRKIMRLERMVHSMTHVPFVAFTADDEYTLQQFRITPVYWIRRILSRRDLRQNTKFYRKYFMFSRDQAKLYAKEFHMETECIYKNGAFPAQRVETKLHDPIRMIYAGKLYCNRWKVLAEIGKALKEINKNEVKMTLEIYTKDAINQKQKNALDDERSIFLRQPVTAEQLKQIYADGDIALHVESDDLKNRLLTRYSFSTKIIDCLASGCAVMAVCPEIQSGYRYLRDEDAAICIDDEKQIIHVLKKITEHPEMIEQYREKAWKCGINNHKKEELQNKLERELLKYVNESKTKRV